MLKTKITGSFLIENVSVGVGTTGYGYNSSKYDYSLFTLSAVNVPLGGGVGVVTYSLTGYLKDGEFPGNFDVLNSAGLIVPEKYFPQFDIYAQIHILTEPSL